MSYANYYRPGALALGAEASASGSASASTDPAETAAKIESFAPTAKQMDEEWGVFLQQARKFKLPMKDGKIQPSAAVEYLLKAMPTIIEATGITPPGSVELAAFASGSSAEFRALLQGNAKPLGMIGIKASAAFACYNLGIDPRIGQVTVEALRDGEITNKDFEAAGGLGGSIGGSALAGFLGIPPVIGGFVGGQVGELAGGLIAGGLKVGGGKAEREAKRRADVQRAQAIRGQLASMRSGVADLIRLSRGQWWGTFDNTIKELSHQWQALECSQVFARFPLLWAPLSQAPSPYFLQENNSSGCNLRVNRNLSIGYGCRLPKMYPWINQGHQCGAIMGCPYPSFRTQATDPFDARVVQAFAAYDIWWQAPANRAAIDELWVHSLPSPDSRPADPAMLRSMRNLTYVQFLADRVKGREGCRSDECRAYADRDMALVGQYYSDALTRVLEQALSLDAINAASNQIGMDMVTSAGIYASALAVQAHRSELLQGRVDRAVANNARAAEVILKASEAASAAERAGRLKNALVNYGALAFGGGLLVAAALRKRSRP